MTDWRTLSGADLNHYVATRLGWRAVDLNDNSEGLRVRGPNWEIRSPDGEASSWGWNELQAWEHSEEIPHFATNLADALSLWDPVTDARLSLVREPAWSDETSQWIVLASRSYFSDSVLYFRRGVVFDELADAVTRGWCAYMDSKGAGV